MALALRMPSKIWKIITVLRGKPSYIFGRFAAFRSGYSKVKHLRQKIMGAGPIEIGDLYRPATGILEIADSGLLVSNVPAERQVAELRTLSYSLQPHLTADAVEKLRDYAKTMPLTAQTADDAGVFTYDQASSSPELRSRVAMAFIANSSECPLVRKLAADPLLYDVVSQFMGYRPERVSSWLFWSFANNLSPQERRARNQTIDFHYDVHGVNFMYVNFYLVDTDSRSGAHVLIEGSSKRKLVRNLMSFSVRLSDAEAVEQYGGRAVRAIEAPAGFGFFEDTSCYHKALAPVDRDRLMLQLRYQ